MSKKLTALFLAFCIVISCGVSGVVSGETAEVNAEMRSLQNPPAMQEVYEAEDAALISASVGTTYDDYSASGYVNGLRRDASVTFTVTVPADGNYGVRLRYSNGSGEDKNLALLLDGVKVRDTKLTPTINWNTWDVKLDSLSLKAGENKITYRNDGTISNGLVMLDKISISLVYEAESANFLGGMSHNNDHPDFSGTGFAAGFQNNGQGVRFDVNAPKAGEYSLVLRYACGDTDSNGQSISVYVNGAKTRIMVNSLRTWDDWGDSVLTINLNEGVNSISVQKDDGDDGSINLDYITVKEVVWEYVGAVESVSGNGTSELTFECDNSVVKVSSAGTDAVKVWADPEGKFSRKYESFAVINEVQNPEIYTVSDKRDYYEFSTANMNIRVYKAAFRMVYLDKQGNTISEHNNDSLGWTSDGELKVNNKLAGDEQFWGLGEKLTSFNRRGDELIMWSHDAYGAEPDSSIPSWENGRWYMANPYFVSSKGYSVLFDNSSRTVFDMGKNSPDTYSFGSLNPNPGGDLIYYFIYGPEIKRLTKTYTDLTGKSFFAPDWAYGNMQCHYGYNQSDIERVAQTYRDKEIPIDVIMADIEWYEYLCTPTQWNKNNFPNPESMLELLDNLNIRMGVIDDPNVTNRDNNADFVTGDTNGYFVKNHTGLTKLINWPWGAASGLMDFFNPMATEWWGEQHNMILNQGIACFWLDMNEPAKYNTDWLFYNEDGKAYGNLSEVKNAYAIKHQEAMYNKVTENGDRTLLLTRSGFSGTQRYASPWTGDIMGSWDSMHQQINLGTSLSMSGYNYWGFDIGGFFNSVSDDQYKRWVELATFTPIHRFHYCAGVEEKEPWTHGAEEVSKKYINLRYTIQPYMYSYSADSIIGIGIEDEYGEGGTGIPLVRPMVMEYPNDNATYNMDTQFMCGESFLVAPVVEGGTQKNVYLPEGNWYDYDDGITVYSGNRNIDYYAPVELLPVFVREGSIIPMQSERQYMDELPVDQVDLDVYPTVKNGDFNFVYYEDDGKTEDYLDGEYATTAFDCSVKRGAVTDEINFTIGAKQGEYTDTDNRSYVIKLHNSAYSNITLTNGAAAVPEFDSLEALEAVASGYFADKSSGICYIKVTEGYQGASIKLTGDAGSNIGICLEAEEGELTDCTVADIDGTTGKAVTGFAANGGAITFENIVVAADGEYGVEIVCAGTGDKNIEIVSGDSTGIVKAASDDFDSVVGIITLKEGANTITVRGYDESLKIDKVIVFQKPVVISEAENYSGKAVKGTLTGGAAVNGEFVSLTAANDGVSFENITVLSDGEYSVRFKYTADQATTATVSAGETDVVVQLPAIRSNELWGEVSVNLPLEAGVNTVSFVKIGSAGTVRLDGFNCSFNPYTTAETALPGVIENSGFETGNINGWTLWDSNGNTDYGYGVDGFDAFSGDRKFYFFDSDKPMVRRLGQSLTGLDDGYYVVKVKTKLYNSTANECSIELTSATASSATTVKQSGVWECTATEPILVTGGTLDIKILYDAPSGGSLQLDDLEIYKAEVGSATISTDILSDKLAEMEEYSKADYEYESWKNYMAVLALATRTADDANAEPGVVIGLINALDSAEAALVSADKALLGDITFDGLINVSDVVRLRTVIMSESWTADELKAGDFDGNATLTVVDVVALRTFIMSKAQKIL